ncbi:hypothetical protein C0J52_21860 [Blattella germanica]|nr:hypothetical protein C0J52_21860 [Blattella germanica]
MLRLEDPPNDDFNIKFYLNPIKVSKQLMKMYSICNDSEDSLQVLKELTQCLHFYQSQLAVSVLSNMKILHSGNVSLLWQATERNTYQSKAATMPPKMTPTARAKIFGCKRISNRPRLASLKISIYTIETGCESLNQFIARWVTAFRVGRDVANDDPRTGRPQVENNTGQLLASLLDVDRRWTARKLAAEVGSRDKCFLTSNALISSSGSGGSPAGVLGERVTCNSFIPSTSTSTSFSDFLRSLIGDLERLVANRFGGFSTSCLTSTTFTFFFGGDISFWPSILREKKIQFTYLQIP